MKKLLLLTIAVLCSVSYVSAQQWQNYYVVEEEGQENASAYWFRIDWNGKYFFMDSDSEDEQKAPIKNYKESGNKRTFDVYYTSQAGGEKFCSVEFITESDSKFKLIQTIGEVKMSYILSPKEPSKSGSNPSTSESGGKLNVNKALDKINILKKIKK